MCILLVSDLVVTFLLSKIEMSVLHAVIAIHFFDNLFSRSRFETCLSSSVTSVAIGLFSEGYVIGIESSLSATGGGIVIAGDVDTSVTRGKNLKL